MTVLLQLERRNTRLISYHCHVLYTHRQGRKVTGVSQSALSVL